MNKNEFRAHKSKPVADWISSLQSEKGDRAALRRAHDAGEIYGVEMAHRLVDGLGMSANHSEAVLFLAALLAQVRESTAALLIDGLLKDAVDGKPETAKLKPLRFAQLLRSDALPERLRMFRRVLQLVDGNADAVDLAYLFLHWQNNATKRDFARRYFAPRSPATDGADETSAVDSSH